MARNLKLENAASDTAALLGELFGRARCPSIPWEAPRAQLPHKGSGPRLHRSAAVVHFRVVVPVPVPSLFHWILRGLKEGDIS